MLTAQGVTVEVEGGHLLLDHVTVEVAPGASLAITGDAGAGKTTLLRVLAGQLAPTSGRVLMPADARRGLLDQDAGQAAAAADEGPLPAGYDAVAAALGLSPEVARRPLATLSRGERIRSRLARLVAARPAYLLLDDTLGVLDLASLVAVTDLLAQVRAGGTGIVLATADSAIAARLADDVAVLVEGRLVPAGA